jgi:hypothetical protein
MVLFHPGRYNTRRCGNTFSINGGAYSKQIPIPHNGPPISPLTDLRHIAPANAIATATVIRMELKHALLTLSSTSSRISVLETPGTAGKALWIAGFPGNLIDRILADASEVVTPAFMPGSQKHR